MLEREKVIGRMDSRQLPVLPSGAANLLRSLTDENIGFAELAQVLERFPSIAARLISLANSSWSSPVSPILSLDSACARLGFGVVRSVSIALAVAAPFNPNKCPGFDAENFWCNALLAADAASWLAAELPSDSGVEVMGSRAAGLLHNLGLLWLVDQFPDESNEVFALVQDNPESSLNHYFIQQIGLDYCEAGGMLGTAWQLPEQIVVAMLCHKKADYDGDHWSWSHLVGLADQMVSATCREQDWQPDEIYLSRLNLQEDQATEVHERLTTQFVKTRELAKSLFSA